MNQSVIITLNSPITASYGPTFSITADVGTVTPGFATLTQLLDGFVASVNTLATHFTITPVFSTCPPIVVELTYPCDCITLVNTSESTAYYNYINCYGTSYENVPLLGLDTIQVCGTFVSADVDITSSTGVACIFVEKDYNCP